jgi:hypothetical protein
MAIRSSGSGSMLSDQDQVKIYLDAAVFAEEIGNCTNLGCFLQQIDDIDIAKTDEITKVAIDALRVRYVRAAEYEAQNGQYSLLKQDHPFNIGMEVSRAHFAKVCGLKI